MSRRPNPIPTSAARALVHAAEAERAAGSRGPWILAFSGGPDSTALALALAAVPAAPSICLVHVDHGLDDGSRERAGRAKELAGEIGISFELVRRDVPAERRRGENLEEAARRVRYDALEGVRSRLGADRILTAHHRDDQIETVLLRMRSGTGILGLSGIRERSGSVWRPALGLCRAELAEIVETSGLEPIEDPSNADLARDRNRIRRALLPHLRTAEPDIDEALAALALRASGARDALARHLRMLHDFRVETDRASLATASLNRHPLLPNLFALQLLENLMGFHPPSSTRFRLELLRQIQISRSPELSGPGGRSYRKTADGRLELLASSPGGPGRVGQAPFSYTLDVPGEVAVPELGGAMRLDWRAFEPWMLCGEPHRAALSLPAPAPVRAEVRNRRPGDRLKPLGAPGIRRLKELLIDRKVPCAERDRIPLLLFGDRIAWVPGVTIADELRLSGGGRYLVAEWATVTEPDAARST